jgi:hypothetical protein
VFAVHTNEPCKSATFGNLLYDFRTAFSSLFRGFWGTNFVGIRGNISREKKKNKKHFYLCTKEKSIVFYACKCASLRLFVVNHNLHQQLKRIGVPMMDIEQKNYPEALEELM